MKIQCCKNCNGKVTQAPSGGLQKKKHSLPGKPTQMWLSWDCELVNVCLLKSITWKLWFSLSHWQLRNPPHKYTNTVTQIHNKLLFKENNGIIMCECVSNCMSCRDLTTFYMMNGFTIRDGTGKKIKCLLGMWVGGWSKWGGNHGWPKQKVSTLVLQFDLHFKRKHWKKQSHLKDMIYVQL